MIRRVAPVAVVLVIGLAACGGSSSSTSSNTTATPSSSSTAATSSSSSASSTSAASTATTTAVNYGAKYLAIVTPLDKAGDTFQTKVQALPDSPSDAQFKAVADPEISALSTAQQQLARVQWPAVAESDIKALVVAAGSVAGDLQQLENATLADSQSEEATLNADLSKAKSETTLVRADLGLPPAS